MKNTTGELLYSNNNNYKLASMDYCYRLYPETAAAGCWSSL